MNLFGNKNVKLDLIFTALEKLEVQNQLLANTLAELIDSVAGIENRIEKRLIAQIEESEIHIINEICSVKELEARTVSAIRSEAEMVRLNVSENVSAEAGDLRQITHQLSRKFGKTTECIRCVFLVHAIESWDAQIDIYLAMLNDSRFDPIVASINRRFPGEADYSGESETSAALDRAGVCHLRLGMDPSWAGLDILRALAPDVIFRQSQWEEDVPPAFQTSRINFARICSVPYGMSIVGKFDPDDGDAFSKISAKSYDQHYHRMAWRVFCETEQTRDYFASFAHSDPKKFIVSGYPKLFRLLSARDEPERWPIAGGRRFRVIWAPHYSVASDWLGFGTFDRVYRDFLKFATQHPDIDFVLKPHPGLFATAVNSGVITQEDMDAFLADWQALPNCVLELGAYAHLFAASDMMVTDGLSFFTEYPIFEKPLIFIDSGRHVPLNGLGDLALAAMQHVSTFDEIEAAIKNYADGAAWPLENERQALLKTLFPKEQDAVGIILDTIARAFVIDRVEGK